jgi:hypothetical protein
MIDRQAFRWNVAVAAFSLAAAGAYAFAGGLLPRADHVARSSYCADDAERRVEPYGAASLKSQKTARPAAASAPESAASQDCVRAGATGH